MCKLCQAAQNACCTAHVHKQSQLCGGSYIGMFIPGICDPASILLLCLFQQLNIPQFFLRFTDAFALVFPVW